MKIQQTQNTNFKANKVSTTLRYSQKGAKEMIEVFKLNPTEDKAFAQKCYFALSQKFTRELEAPQKRLKEFFKDFLGKFAVDKEYFLAIKNEETIAGGMITMPFDKSVWTISSFSTYPKDFNISALFYSLITDSQNSHKGYDIDIKNHRNDFSYFKERITPSQMTYVKKVIKDKQPLTTFIKEKYEKTDLDDVLNTKDFETEVVR